MINLITICLHVRKWWLLGVMILLASCNAATPTVPSETTPQPMSAKPFDGVKIRLLTYSGPQIYTGVKNNIPGFEAVTGAKVELIDKPYGELYQAIMDDVSTGKNEYDAYVYAPQWMADFVTPHYVMDLTDKVTADKALAWDDIAPFFRTSSVMYQGRVYAIPLDGDFQMVYYRADVLTEHKLNPPQTWTDYLTIAKALHGEDFNGDGQPDYGSCITKKQGTEAYWMFWSIASAFLQTQGTKQGTFFEPQTMQPVVNNEAVAKALDIYQQTTLYGPPHEADLALSDIRKLFMAGQCALSIDWGDTGTLALAADSKVVNKVGAVILPGTTEVLDRKTAKLVACDKVTCPYALDGVNHAPFAAFGGWAGSINAASKATQQEAAYAFISYISQPQQSNTDVTIGATGFNPYRISQFKSRELWLKAGMSQEAADRYLGAIGVSLNSPNMVLDLRIPQANRYQQEVLDTLLAQFLAEKVDKTQFMQQLEADWNKITDTLGRETQQKAYRSSLGLNP